MFSLGGVSLCLALFVCSGSAQTAPAITRTSSFHITIGSPDLNFVVDGSDFTPGAVLKWNDTRLSTIFINSTRLLTFVPAAMLRRYADVTLNVINPNGAISNEVGIIITVARPGITSISPNFVTPGGPSFTLTIDGINLYSTTKVSLTSDPSLTPFQASETQLKVTVPASYIRSPGVLEVHLQNSGTDESGFGFGSGSNVVSLYVGVPVPATKPAITSLTPMAGVSFGPPFTLTVKGRNFDRNSLVYWNARGVIATYVDSTTLKIPVTTDMQMSSGFNEVFVQVAGVFSENANYRMLPSSTALLAISPSTVSALQSSATLTVDGYGFKPGAVARFNKLALQTTFVNANRLTCIVPASLMANGSGEIDVLQEGSPTGSATLDVTGPKVSEGGIVSVFSSLPAIAPGSLIAIYGTDLSSGTAQAGSTPLPLTLNRTSVSINGTAAPLFYVSPTQVNVQVPYSAAPGPATLTVRNGDVVSRPAAFEISPTAPSILTLTPSDHVVAVNTATGTLNSREYPAGAGEYVTIFVIGQGVVSPAVPTGAAAPPTPLSYPVAPVQARIGGQPVEVQFAGLAPGFVGLLQMNLKVPILATQTHIMDVTIGGVRSNVASISVRGPF